MVETGSPLADAVLADIENSPSPYHAAERAAKILRDSGFAQVERGEPIDSEPGPYFVLEGGSLIAWIQMAEHRGFTILGAHTDSPNLRVKTNADVTANGYEQIAMEIYGGVLLNSWLDRGLGLAGRVAVRDAKAGAREELLSINEAIMTIPQLAIHLDRDVVSKGLKLDPQKHLVPIWNLTGPNTSGSSEFGSKLGNDGSEAKPDSDSGSVGELKAFVAEHLSVNADDILAWDLMAFDVQPPALIGRNKDMFATARIDNLLSTFCGVRALTELWDSGPANDALPRTPVVALYDHEEIGSESATGAAGAMLSSMLERIAAAEGADRGQFLVGLTNSYVVSADCAHATHPNYSDRHEPGHHIALNGGIVIKRNANQRYATDATSEAFIMRVCDEAGVPVQFYIHRNDLPCGSTIGPITAAKLGVPTVDIGVPQLAMHSIREMAGITDIDYLEKVVLGSFTSL